MPFVSKKLHTVRRIQVVFKSKEFHAAMIHNGDGTDKTARIAAGIALPVFTPLYGGAALLWGIASVGGLIALATERAGCYPANSLLGINTSKEKRGENERPMQEQQCSPCSPLKQRARLFHSQTGG